MPRRYYRRTRTIVRAPRKKWATNIKTSNFYVNPTSETPATRIPWITLVANSTQSSSPTPVILKAGNFKVNADVNFKTPSGVGNAAFHLIAFILFLPEGVAPADNQQFGNLITSHPEYIMAWRQIDTERSTSTESTNQNTNRVSFSSRLKRNLNSGDSIVFGILDQSAPSTASSISAALTCQFWTCSN